MKKYFAKDIQPTSTDDDIMICISDSVCDDNYIFLHSSTGGTVRLAIVGIVYATDIIAAKSRSDPFRHPAIFDVLATILLTKDFQDRFNLQSYFYPEIPVSLIILACTAVRIRP